MNLDQLSALTLMFFIGCLIIVCTYLAESINIKIKIVCYVVCGLFIGPPIVLLWIKGIFG